MGISTSTMKCPVCLEQPLETLTTSFGSWDRCTSCKGLFIHQDLVAAASLDRAATLEALAEVQTLLLPTERTCPKCLQKLFDGRVRSRGVILALCPTCMSYWTTLPNLRQFDEAVEKTLLAQAEIAAAAQAAADAVGGPASTGEPLKRAEDSALGSLFRGSARIFD